MALGDLLPYVGGELASVVARSIIVASQKSVWGIVLGIKDGSDGTVDYRASHLGGRFPNDLDVSIKGPQTWIRGIVVPG